MVWSRHICFFVLLLYYFFFFFQAEDGIRDSSVTGVQTCALPISYPREWERNLLLDFCQFLLRFQSRIHFDDVPIPSGMLRLHNREHKVPTGDRGILRSTLRLSLSLYFCSSHPPHLQKLAGAAPAVPPRPRSCRTLRLRSGQARPPPVS